MHMTQAGLYTVFWNHQTQLFSEIEQIKYQTATAELLIANAQQTLNQPEVKRYDRRKAKWVIGCQRRHLKTLDHALQLSLQSLSACQVQIEEIHNQAAWTTGSYDHGDGIDVDPVTPDSYMPPTRSLSPDSGFAEPALYAHPFVLDLSEDTSDHLFSHETQQPLLSITTDLEVKSTSKLSPTAKPHTPCTSKHLSSTFSPQAPPFTPKPFIKAKPEDATQPLNNNLLFQPLIWSDWADEDPEEQDMTPFLSPKASETQKTETNKVEAGEKKHERRYSIAAIELIESRLRHKRVVSDSGAWGKREAGKE